MRILTTVEILHSRIEEDGKCISDELCFKIYQAVILLGSQPYPALCSPLLFRPAWSNRFNGTCSSHISQLTSPSFAQTPCTHTIETPLPTLRWRQCQRLWLPEDWTLRRAVQWSSQQETIRKAWIVDMFRCDLDVTRRWVDHDTVKIGSHVCSAVILNRPTWKYWSSNFCFWTASLGSLQFSDFWFHTSHQESFFHGRLRLERWTWSKAKMGANIVPKTEKTMTKLSLRTCLSLHLRSEYVFFIQDCMPACTCSFKTFVLVKFCLLGGSKWFTPLFYAWNFKISLRPYRSCITNPTPPKGTFIANSFVKFQSLYRGFQHHRGINSNVPQFHS